MKLEKINEIFLKNNILSMLHIDIEPTDFKYNLLLSLSNDEGLNEKVSFYFYDISNVEIKDIGGGLTQFMHLRISYLDNGSDRNKYLIEDLDDQKISFEFGFFDLLN